MADTPTAPAATKPFPPFNLMAYFGGNLLLGGLSYVMLRQYARFFIFAGAMVVAAFLPGPISYLVVFASAFDAYFLAKKLRGQPEPQYRAGLMWLAVAVWILMIALAIFASIIEMYALGT